MERHILKNEINVPNIIVPNVKYFIASPCSGERSPEPAEVPRYIERAVRPILRRGGPEAGAAEAAGQDVLLLRQPGGHGPRGRQPAPLQTKPRGGLGTVGCG